MPLLGGVYSISRPNPKILAPRPKWDSLDIYTFAILFYALQTKRGTVNFWSFTLAFFLGYWLSGLLIARVGQEILGLSGPAAMVVDALYIAVGLALIGVGTTLLVRNSRKETPAPAAATRLDEKVARWKAKYEHSRDGRPGVVDRWGPLLFGAGGFLYIMANLPFALPYLGVILVWERFHPPPLGWAAALLFYAIVFILPYLVLFGVYPKYAARATALFEKAFAFCKKPRVVGGMLVAMGGLLLVLL